MIECGGYFPVIKQHLIEQLEIHCVELDPDSFEIVELQWNQAALACMLQEAVRASDPATLVCFQALC